MVSTFPQDAEANWGAAQAAATRAAAADRIGFNFRMSKRFIMEKGLIDFDGRRWRQKRVVDGGLKQLLVHSISDDGFMSALTPTSKYNADWDFLLFLRDEGRKCADEWLAKNFAKLGVESSLDVEEVYL